MRLFWILIGLVAASPVMAVGSLVFNNTTSPDETVFLDAAVDVQIDPTAEDGRGSVVVALVLSDDRECTGLEMTPDPGTLARLQIDRPGISSLVYYVDADFVYDGTSTALTVEPAGPLEVACPSSLLFQNGFE